MNEIEKYQSKVPIQSKLGIAKSLFQDDNIEDYNINLLIIIVEENLNIKEFSSYLDFIYRIDGLMSELGYNKYVHSRYAQIEITKIRAGSVEIIIERLLNSPEADKLVIIWLALKYLPQLVNSLTDSASKIMDLAIKKEEYIEKRDRRKFRKQIREVINEEVELTLLDKKQKEKLVNLLDEVYSKNRTRLPSSFRFAKDFVQSVQLIIKEKSN